MEHFLLTFAAAFLGTLAAALTARWLTGETPAPGERAQSRVSRGFALFAAATFAIVAALTFYVISSGDLAPGLALAILPLTLATLAYLGRAFRNT